MPRHSPYRIELTDGERAVLESLARSVYVAVLAGHEGADGVDGRRRAAQRPDRSPVALRA